MDIKAINPKIRDAAKGYAQSVESVGQKAVIDVTNMSYTQKPINSDRQFDHNPAKR